MPLAKLQIVMQSKLYYNLFAAKEKDTEN